MVTSLFSLLCMLVIWYIKYTIDVYVSALPDILDGQSVCLNGCLDRNTNEPLSTIIGSLQKNDGNSNCNAKFLLFHNFRFKRFLVFHSNLLPLRASEAVHFNFITWKPHFWRSVLQIWACEVKLSRFKCLL